MPEARATEPYAVKRQVGFSPQLVLSATKSGTSPNFIERIVLPFSYIPTIFSRSRSKLSRRILLAVLMLRTSLPALFVVRLSSGSTPNSAATAENPPTRNSLRGREGTWLWGGWDTTGIPRSVAVEERSLPHFPMFVFQLKQSSSDPSDAKDYIGQESLYDSRRRVVWQNGASY